MTETPPYEPFWDDPNYAAPDSWPAGAIYRAKCIDGGHEWTTKEIHDPCPDCGRTSAIHRTQIN